MACLHPIWIRNRRYYDKKDNIATYPVDLYKSSISLRPWDVSRQYLLVPCGKCEECLRKARNDWYVRLERELSRGRKSHTDSIFITITISPKYYESAFNNPSSFIRKFNERIRHKFGSSIKHAFFQEFGKHPKTGDVPRLHFHGFLFHCGFRYNDIRKAVGDLGFLWMARASHKRARYVVKYVVKELDVYSPSGELLKGYDCKRFRRKFISAGVGDYLGNMPAPSFNTSIWSYMDIRSGISYNYAIPRYYNKYLKPRDQMVREISSAYSYALFGGDAAVISFLKSFAERYLPQTSISSRNSYSWLRKNFRRFTEGAQNTFKLLFPSFYDFEVDSFVNNEFSISFLT